ncbi:MAG TPA: response regulator [Chitinophagaceae bacterium]|nr:response regulator [Chitinophagaceae bacterium]
MQITLLIVDDDPDDLWLFSEAVYEINKAYRCITASNGKEALQLLQNAIVKPHYIFMDLNLPVMNGKECLREIKKKPQFADIPVIIYSTSKLKTDMEEVYKLGAAHFLTKPNTFHDIVKIISDVLTGKLEEIDH